MGVNVWFGECLVCSTSDVVNVLFCTRCDECLVWSMSGVINVCVVNVVQLYFFNRRIIFVKSDQQKNWQRPISRKRWRWRPTPHGSSSQLFQDSNILKYIESRNIKSWRLSNPKEWQSSNPEDWGSWTLDFRIVKSWVRGFNNPRIKDPQILTNQQNTKFSGFKDPQS